MPNRVHLKQEPIIISPLGLKIWFKVLAVFLLCTHILSCSVVHKNGYYQSRKYKVAKSRLKTAQIDKKQTRQEKLIADLQLSADDFIKVEKKVVELPANPMISEHEDIAISTELPDIFESRPLEQHIRQKISDSPEIDDDEEEYVEAKFFLIFSAALLVASISMVFIWFLGLAIVLMSLSFVLNLLAILLLSNLLNKKREGSTVTAHRLKIVALGIALLHVAGIAIFLVNLLSLSYYAMLIFLILLALLVIYMVFMMAIEPKLWFRGMFGSISDNLHRDIRRAYLLSPLAFLLFILSIFAIEAAAFPFILIASVMFNCLIIFNIFSGILKTKANPDLFTGNSLGLLLMIIESLLLFITLAILLQAIQPFQTVLLTLFVLLAASILIIYWMFYLAARFS
jgi:hypothetical protein